MCEDRDLLWLERLLLAAPRRSSRHRGGGTEVRGAGSCRKSPQGGGPPRFHVQKAGSEAVVGRHSRHKTGRSFSF
ncbi:unnamed protein product [Polarella glacialis]|uniref:Uncharacterized protein n=1 Tax=Polarella glacialis TaxID=89957 RepID=A0A813LN89_POLGL|nr:unnamed protein product [Polarella glacialis]